MWISESIKKNALIYAAAVLLLAIALIVYFWFQLNQLKGKGDVSKVEVEQIVASVSRLMVLPDGETPTVATVTDPEKLRNQAFFEKAKAGDKVLIYTNAKRAILYDPAIDKIIDVAQLNIGG